MERSECECKEGNTWTRHADDGRPGMGNMPVCALDVGPIRKTDGDDGGYQCERGEIASDFEKVPCGSRVDFGGEGVDILELIIWLILFKLLDCSLCAAVPPVHC
jgi:hypothetical protein